MRIATITAIQRLKLSSGFGCTPDTFDVLTIFKGTVCQLLDSPLKFCNHYVFCTYSHLFTRRTSNLSLTTR